MGSLGKPGVVRECSAILIQVLENKLFSTHIISVHSCMAAFIVVVPFAVSKCKLYHFA